MHYKASAIRLIQLLGVREIPGLRRDPCLDSQHQFTAGDLVVIDAPPGDICCRASLARDLNGIRHQHGCYVNAGTVGSYLTRLATDFLADDLARFQKLVPIVFEGICARDVLDSVALSGNASVYVKKISLPENRVYQGETKDDRNIHIPAGQSGKVSRYAKGLIGRNPVNS